MLSFCFCVDRRPFDNLVISLQSFFQTKTQNDWLLLCINQFQRGICSRCQSRGLGISVPWGDPRAFDTYFRKMDEFIGKDMAFVKDWLVRQGLEKLLDVFKDMFSHFYIFLHYL